MYDLPSRDEQYSKELLSSTHNQHELAGATLLYSSLLFSSLLFSSLLYLTPRPSQFFEFREVTERLIILLHASKGAYEF